MDIAIAAGDASKVRIAGTNIPEVRKLSLRSAIYLAQNDEEGLRLCQEAADRAREIEPTSAGAMQMAAFSRIRRATNGWVDRTKAINEALELAKKVDGAGGVPGMRQMLEGSAMLAIGDFEKAVASCRESTQVAPNIANARIQYARALNAVGEFDQARSEAIKGISAHPNIFPVFLIPLGISLVFLDRMGDAVAVFAKFRELSPQDNRDCMLLAVAHAANGEPEQAQSVHSEVLDIFPNLTIDQVLAPYPFKNDDHTERLRGHLAQLGMPEE